MDLNLSNEVFMKFGGGEEVINSFIDGVAAIAQPFMNTSAVETPKRAAIHEI